MGTLWQNGRCGDRVPATKPGFTAAVVLILAVGARVEAGAPAIAPAVLPGGSSLADSNQGPRDKGAVSEGGQSASEEEPPSRLVAWWRFDEPDGSVAGDSSGHGFTGTLRGNPQWQPTGGRAKGALALDGAEGFVEIKNQPAFDITDAITVAAWIKVNRFDKRWQTIIAKGDSAWRLQRAAQEDTVAFHCTGLKAVKGLWPYGIEGRESVNDGQWHHVVGVYDGAVISLYIDGVLDNASRASGTIQTNSFPVSIGANAEASGRNWNGLIDEVCVFACALNASGVSALCSGGEPTVIAGQASALVSAEDVKAKFPAGQGSSPNGPELNKNTMRSDRREKRRGPVASIILAGAALVAGVYVARRRRGVS